MKQSTAEHIQPVDQASPNVEVDTGPSANSSHPILHVDLPDKATLYAAYMPFVKGGGLFVCTRENCLLNEEVFILLSLMDEPEKLPLSGKVVWTTPDCAQGGKPVGVGIQFDSEHENTVNVRNKIEGYLGGALKSENATDTM